MARGAWCRCARAHGRMAGTRQPGTTARACHAQGSRRSHQRRLSNSGSEYREENKFAGYSHPAKVMPAIPLASTIGMPTVMCSQVPKLSPVHIAPKRCEPAKNERVSTNGRFGTSERAIRPCEVILGCEIHSCSSRLRTAELRSAYQEHAVDVVQVSVLPSSVVHVILWHRDLWPVEY